MLSYSKIAYHKVHKGKNTKSQRKGLVDAFVFKNSLPQSAQREKHKVHKEKAKWT